MNTSLLSEYQKQLVYGCLDDFSAISALSGYLGNQNGEAYLIWAEAVIDFLYLNQISGLIEVFEPENYLPIDELKTNLMVNVDAHGHWPNNWHVMYFNSTSKTEALAKKYNLCSWDGWKQPLNVDFMNEVIQIYSDFDALTKGCSPNIAEQRITVAKRVITQLIIEPPNVQNDRISTM